MNMRRGARWLVISLASVDNIYLEGYRESLHQGIDILTLLSPLTAAAGSDRMTRALKGWITLLKDFDR